MYRIAASCLITALLVTALITGCEPETGSGDDEEQQGEWRLEIIDDSGNVGRAPAVALDENGCPHVAYCSVDPAELRYARRTTGAWNYGTLQPIGLFHGTSITMADGLPFIAFLSMVGVEYLYWGGDDWETESVDTGLYPSLAIDAAGTPHIAYQDSSSFDLMYAYRDPVRWLSEEVDMVGLTGFYNSLELDSAGRPHIAYHTRSANEVKLAVYDGDDWSSAVVDEGSVCDLAVDDRDVLHLAYYGLPERVLRYAINPGDGWDIQTVAYDLGNYGVDVALDLNSAGEPRIACSDSDNGVLRYAVARGAGWAVENIVVDDAVDTYIDLAVDGQDRPHIVYRSDNILRYATKDQ